MTTQTPLIKNESSLQGSYKSHVVPQLSTQKIKSKKEAYRQKKRSTTRTRLEELCTTACFFFVLGDLIFIGIFSHSIFTFCDKPLQWWCLGSVLLSSPLTVFLEFLGRRQSYHALMNLQLYAFIVALIWLGYGTYLVNICHFCPTTSSFMWWSVFVVVTISWSSLVGIIIMIVAFTILSVKFFFFLYKNKTINPAIWLKIPPILMRK